MEKSQVGDPDSSLSTFQTRESKNPLSYTFPAPPPHDLCCPLKGVHFYLGWSCFAGAESPELEITEDEVLISRENTSIGWSGVKVIYTFH